MDPIDPRPRAIALAREGKAPIQDIATDLGIDASLIFRWVTEDDLANEARTKLAALNTELEHVHRSLSALALEIDSWRRVLEAV